MLQSLHQIVQQTFWGGKTIVLGVSNIWNDNKGLSDFICLGKEHDFVVVLVGLNPEQVRMLSGNAYKHYNIVPISRTQNQQELAMVYSLADVVLSLSYYETYMNGFRQRE